MFKFFLGIINRIFQILFLFITNPNKVFFFIRKKKEAILNAELNELWKRQDYILVNLPKTNRQFYNSKKNITQIEHQVGRYLNCKNIVDEINNENIPGGILEFGSWLPNASLTYKFQAQKVSTIRFTRYYKIIFN